jgi:pyruvate carboxylase subunit B
MKRKFNVTVDGKTYNIEVEEILDENLNKTNLSYKPKAHVKIDSTKTQDVSGLITAPLPGLVSKLNVNKGDRVEKRKVLLILEAMKMENEIHSPSSGTVNEVYVKEGDTVGRGEPLIKIS